MRLVRPAVTLAVVASLAASGLATAATKPKPKPVKPVCNLILDEAGDASLQSPIPSDDSLDVVSGDVASDAKTVTAVIRVKNLAAASPSAQTGRNYYFLFNVPSATNQIYMSYESDVIEATANYGELVPGTGAGSYTRRGAGTVVVDPAKNEIRISAPASDLGAIGKITPGTKISNLEIAATQVVGIVVFTADEATGSKAYTAGAPSCVKPGK